MDIDFSRLGDGSVVVVEYPREFFDKIFGIFAPGGESLAGDDDYMDPDVPESLGYVIPPEGSRPYFLPGEPVREVVRIVGDPYRFEGAEVGDTLYSGDVIWPPCDDERYIRLLGPGARWMMGELPSERPESVFSSIVSVVSY